jgi:AcrR family transcriptional regulator
MATDQTREKLLQAAIQAFVETGFNGARVDDIARAAKANKAMIYYHFRDKAGLYQAVLLDLTGPIHEHIAALASIADPERRLRAFYLGLIERFAERPALPKIMLHEVLAGGKNMKPETARAFSGILEFVRATLQQGEAAGRFGKVHPMLFHLSVLAPAFLIFAGSDFRERVLAKTPIGVAQPSLADLVGHVDAVLARLVTHRP